MEWSRASPGQSAVTWSVIWRVSAVDGVGEWERIPLEGTTLRRAERTKDGGGGGPFREADTDKRNEMLRAKLQELSYTHKNFHKLPQCFPRKPDERAGSRAVARSLTRRTPHVPRQKKDWTARLRKQHAA
ncbi:hypothetical protein E2C01_054120 [Portunus trituberculatus]|uniref:Uncharacterized protein n=1 Tax=Portunus trituberculatus TaxID=210409 RepID=A0A5B7GU51_PORTR|nr:hypothetical protein [Portunus trituberculatus]